MSSQKNYDGSSLMLCGSDGKGSVLFTGPDGVTDYNVHVEEQRCIGHDTMSPEGTGDVQYLCRAAKGTPHPPPKTSRVGEVGWGVPKLSDNSLLKSGQQIMLKEFRQAVEDRHTHLYQNPYYPPTTQNSRSNRTEDGGDSSSLRSDSDTSTQY